jgi:hypothetical protein
MGGDEALEHRVHPSIPQGERLTTTLRFEVAFRGERFDLAHRPEHVEGVSNLNGK